MSSEFAEEVFKVRQAHASIFPSRRRIHQFVDDLEELLFPHISSEAEYYAPAEIDGQLAVLSRDLILSRVWGYDYYGDSRTVDVHIRWLRQKIEADPSNPQHIITVRGVGYRFEA